MAISEAQKVDFLWKKLGYGRAKTDTNANKKATNESIASPLLLRGNNVWSQAGDIPATMPASSAGVVTVYPTSAPDETVADATASTNRTWKTELTDWIPPEIGSTYLVKVYIHTAGDASNAAASGTQVFGAGSGNNDEWFFDYQSGTLHFIGTNLPNGVNFSGKSVYVSGARYTGIKGVAVPGATGSFTDVDAEDGNFTGVTTSAGGAFSNQVRVGVAGSSEIDTISGNLVLDSATGTVEIDDNVTISGDLDVDGRTDLDDLVVTGVSTFSANIDANGNLDVDGQTDLDVLNVAELATFSANIDANGDLDVDGRTDLDDLVVTGVSTFSANIDANGNLDVDGQTDLDVLNVAELATFSANIDANGNLDVDGHTELDDVNISGVATATALHLGAEGSAIRVTSDSITGPSSITIDPAGVGDNTGTVFIAGNLQVDGTQTTINSTTVNIDDKNIQVATGAANDAAADGGGITVNSGEGNKTFQFEATGDNWGASENLNLASSKEYKINNTSVLNATTLGGAVVNSSLTNVGTLTGLTVSGNASVEGDVDLGNATTDTITATGRFDSDLVPSTDDARDLGTSTLQWRNLHLDGTANIDALVADTADINAGTIDGATIGANSASTGAFTTINASSNVTVSGDTSLEGNVDLGNATSDTITATGRFDSDLVPSTDDARDLGTSSLQWRNLFIDGTANIDSLVADTADIDGGSIDGTAIGANSASTGAFTSVTASGNITVTGDLDVDGHTDLDNVSISGVTTHASGVTFSGAIDANSTATFATAVVEDLTNNRVVIAGAGGELEDDGNLTFDGSTLAVGVALDVDGHTDLDDLIVAGVSTFSANIDANGNLDVDGRTDLDDLIVAGVSTFSANIDANGNLDVDGHTELDDVNVSGIATIASLKLASGSTVVAILDEDNLGSASDTALATQQSIKTYIDNQLTGSDLDFQGDSGGTLSIDLDSETLTIAGTTNEIETSGSGNTLTIGLPDNVTLGGDLTVNGNDIKGNGGTTAITISTADVTIAGDLTVTGNDIKGSGGTAITMDGSNNVAVTGDLTVTGNDIKSSGGTTAFTLSGANATTAGNHTTTGNHNVTGVLNADNTTDSTSSTTGGVIVDGGLGVAKQLYVGAGASVGAGLTVAGHVLPAADDTYDLGASGTEWRNLYVDGTANIDAASIASLALASGATVTAINDEDNMSSNSATALATQQSIKAYVDAEVGAVDVTTSLAGDSGTGSVSTSQTLTVSGTANEIETSVSGQTFTIGLPNTVNVTTAIDVPTVEATNIKARDGTAAITITDSTGAVATSSNLTVGGNLVVNGSTTQVNSTITTIQDQLIELGTDSGSAPSSDLNRDIGVIFHWHDGSNPFKAGVYFDDSTGRIVAAKKVSESAGVLTNNEGAGFESAEYYVSGCSGTQRIFGCSSGEIVLENTTIDAGAF